MPRSRIWRTTALLALALFLSACEDGPAAAPPPTSGFPVETLTEAPEPSGAPTPSATAGLRSGWVRIRISGDLELETELTKLLSAIATPPPGAFALVWTGGGRNAVTLGLGGSSVVGTRPTSQTLVLTIAAPTDGGVSTWVSRAGECEIDLEVAQVSRFAGTFVCDDLRSDAGDVVDVSGVFEATG